MKENEDHISDDFLKKLIGKSSLETPSDGFVEKVMERIMPQPETVPGKGVFLLYLKYVLGFLTIAVVLTGFFWTSDIPVLNWLPGREYFNATILPAFDSLFAWVKHLSGSGKGLTIPFMILGASGLFFLLDRLLAYRSRVRNSPAT